LEGYTCSAPVDFAAIMSRESNAGRALDRDGWGDHGNGYGLMQVILQFTASILKPRLAYFVY